MVSHICTYRRKHAFTLVELLVVVSIIVILVAILVPTLSRARDAARTTQCANNMRELSQLVFDFASAHQGRGPGSGVAPAGLSNPADWSIVSRITGAPTSVSDPMAKVVITAGGGGSQSWAEILNNDVLGRSTYGTARMGVADSLVNKALVCPNFIAISSRRPFTFNFDAGGGVNYTTGGGSPINYPTCGIYGIMAKPQPPYALYTLGAQLSRFTADQFMFVEHEAADDTFAVNTYQTPPNGTIPTSYNATYPAMYMGDNASFPPYDAGSGAFAFRHPYFKRANFAFFDGHVELLTPNDEINTARRMSLGGQ